jgi:hypothetical protein
VKDARGAGAGEEEVGQDTSNGEEKRRDRMDRDEGWQREEKNR